MEAIADSDSIFLNPQLQNEPAGALILRTKVEIVHFVQQALQLRHLFKHGFHSLAQAKVEASIVVHRHLQLFGQISDFGDGHQHGGIDVVALKHLQPIRERIFFLIWLACCKPPPASNALWKDVRASSPLRIFPRPSLPTEFFRVRAE